jgi:hypothetical protein
MAVMNNILNEDSNRQNNHRTPSLFIARALKLAPAFITGG